MATHAIHVGVDVGGTNTDAVVLSEGEVLGWSKQVTTGDVTTGVIGAVSSALDCASEAIRGGEQNVRFSSGIRVKRVHIGTTHFINAVIQKQHLVPVAVIRLCGPTSRALPPFSYFPKDLQDVIGGPVFMVNGGFYFDGTREICSLVKSEIIDCLEKIKDAGLLHIVVCGIFSPINNAQELQVEKWIQEIYPKASYTLSHTVAEFGLLTRENSAVLNECLRPLSEKTFSALSEAFRQLHLHCPFYFTQNDGTLLNTDQAIKYPILTFASGATNSMRGAAFLSGVKDAVVLDIGGTSTDVGILKCGFPRQASTKIEVGGVMTSFQMPDTLSIGLGGGSLVKFIEPKESSKSSEVLVGPESVGNKLRQASVTFGGETLTATDIAVAEGLSDLGRLEDYQRSKWIPDVLAKAAVNKIHKMVEDVIDRMKKTSEEIPVILVGGGSIVLDIKSHIKGTTKVIRPNHFQVANAIGAALSQTSAKVDTLEDLTVTTRDDAIANAKKLATDLVLNKGADPNTVEVIDIFEVPLTYMPGNLTRIRVKAVGSIMFSSGNLEGVPWKGSRPIKMPEIIVTPTHKLQGNNNDAKSDTESTKADIHRSENDKADEENQNHSQELPTIDRESGEWLLTPYDLECLAIGAGILGCGGGGNPLNGKLRLLRLLSEGKKLRVISPKRYCTNASEGDYSIPCALMGAPTVDNEMLDCIEKNLAPVKALTDLCISNDYDLHTDEVGKGLCIEKGDGFSYITDYKKRENSNQSSDKRITALFSAEIGGCNCMAPLIVGAELDLPVLDCDLMGRAFPELQMTTNSIYGEPLYPTALGDHNGKNKVCVHADSPKHIEDYFRHVSVEMGCTASIAFRPMQSSVILKKTVLNSISRAWKLGQAVINSRREKTSPIDAILQFEKGKHICTGKVCDIQRKTEGGFAKGDMMIEGIDEFQEQEFCINFQNENLLVKKICGNNTEVVANVPDLISIVNFETGEPIPTDEVRYGLRVAVLALPAPPILRTPEALEVIGPSAFGYTDVTYHPIGEYLEHSAVPPE